MPMFGTDFRPVIIDMTNKKYLVVFPARNGFVIRRGDNANEALDGDEQYIAATPQQAAEIMKEHCQAFEHVLPEGTIFKAGCAGD